MTILKYDVAIIGGGPGGYVTAIRSAQLGFKTVVIEREHIGGICLNWGCIPTKALLRSAEIYRNTKNSKEFGLSVNGLEFDIHKIVERSRRAAQQLSKGVEYLLKKNKVDVIDGHGSLTGDGRIIIEKEMSEAQDVSARHIILATGARPRSLPGMETDGEMIWNYKHAMTPGDMPNSILVIGSGAIGIEFASFYHSLGVDVTVVEVLPNILPAEDEEISILAQQIFEKE